MASAQTINGQHYCEHGQLYYEPRHFSSLNSYANLDYYYSDVYKFTLNPDGPMDYENELIRADKIQLKPHQRRALYAMRHNETLNERISPGSDFSYYCDNVGSGKSLVVLALIAKYKELGAGMPNRFLRQYVPSPITEIRGYKQFDNIIFKSSLIVVPHTILSQWEGYIRDYTKLKVFIPKTLEAIEKMTLDDMNNVDIVLVKSTKYNQFIHKLNVLTSTVYGNYRSDEKNPNYNRIDFKFDSTLTHTKDEIQNMIHKLKKYLTKTQDEYEVIIPEYETIHNTYLFQRVFIDEATDINLCGRSIGTLPGLFKWYITSSVSTLLTSYGGVNTKFRDIALISAKAHWIPYYPRLVIRNNEEFIKMSFEIPPYQTNMIRCLTPEYMRVMNGLAQKSIISAEALEALSGGDIAKAMELMGCESVGCDDIIESLIKKFKKELSVRNHHLKELTQTLAERTEARNSFRAQIDNLRNNSGDELAIAGLCKQRDYYASLVASAEESIKIEEQHIANTEEKIKDITTRVDITVEHSCPVCMGEISNPLLTPCCKNLFCAECLITSINAVKSCPLCRSAIKPVDLKAIQKSSQKPKKASQDEAGPAENPLPSKVEALFNIMNAKPDGRFLIFTNFDNVFTSETLHDKFTEANITYDYLKGSSGHITHIVNQFNSGKLNVLILNARFLGSGINLQSATDTIIFHKLSKDIEHQVIGRAQRPGRISPLMVNFLYYDNEFNFGV